VRKPQAVRPVNAVRVLSDTKNAVAAAFVRDIEVQFIAEFVANCHVFDVSVGVFAIGYGIVFAVGVGIFVIGYGIVFGISVGIFGINFVFIHRKLQHVNIGVYIFSADSEISEIQTNAG
jgi:hypothetical protein